MALTRCLFNAQCRKLGEPPRIDAGYHPAKVLFVHTQLKQLRGRRHVLEQRHLKAVLQRFPIHWMYRQSQALAPPLGASWRFPARHVARALKPERAVK